MQSITNIPPETNHIPSGEWLEYNNFISNEKESKISFLNRVGSDVYDYTFF